MNGQKIEGEIKPLSINHPQRGKARIEINREWCKGCGICIAFCPHEVFGLGPDEKAVVLRSEDCNACGMCELRCPDMAISLAKEGFPASEQNENERETERL